MNDHDDYDTHRHVLRQPTARYVVVPIGRALPRRDKELSLERHKRLMLVFFRPWRTVHDLRLGAESWSDAFQRHTFTPETIAIMDNMQILHECRDERD
ncbi:hypothetical protein FPV67DRAFT_1424117, partial [Lyophyllum atratum]